MKKGFKNVLALALSSFMVLGTAACGSSSSERGETSQETDKTQIGIVQMADNGAFTDMREGFIAEMNEKGYSHWLYPHIFSYCRISTTTFLSHLEEAAFTTVRIAFAMRP